MRQGSCITASLTGVSSSDGGTSPFRTFRALTDGTRTSIRHPTYFAISSVGLNEKNLQTIAQAIALILSHFPPTSFFYITHDPSVLIMEGLLI